jgi:hypothetical protein
MFLVHRKGTRNYFETEFAERDYWKVDSWISGSWEFWPCDMPSNLSTRHTGPPRLVVTGGTATPKFLVHSSRTSGRKKSYYPITAFASAGCSGMNTNTPALAVSW